MRLWSLHPSLLDRAGLGASWREGLLAQAVLAGRTRGYRNHPPSPLRGRSRPRRTVGTAGVPAVILPGLARVPRRALACGPWTDQ
ncbi:pyrimidine dimer DNA glycosylase/endonuclease V [Raineyella antarctica]|uniref:pyrimidine dimer DNA glycosylase/endonuclease V n=1 Tax=Raineyella antarctica TaxID=1577474 RepID=UPI000A580DAA|nr:pyrimidine dimer DNA glycosylase/endonuclease V [Raineyella antarctica]